MINIARYGYKKYNITPYDSFQHGLEKNFIKYAKYPEPRTEENKFYSIKHGTEEVLRFCFNNYWDYNDK